MCNYEGGRAQGLRVLGLGVLGMDFAFGLGVLDLVCNKSPLRLELNSLVLHTPVL